MKTKPIPCIDCLVLAACRHKKEIECQLLFDCSEDFRKEFRKEKMGWHSGFATEIIKILPKLYMIVRNIEMTNTGKTFHNIRFI